MDAAAACVRAHVDGLPTEPRGPDRARRARGVRRRSRSSRRVLADPENLKVGQHDRQPAVGAAVRVRAARHRQLRAPDLGSARSTARRISLLVGIAATLIAIVHRHGRRRRRRLLRRLDRRRPLAPDRVVPRHPVPPARDRARGDPRPVRPEHHPRHRDHVVADDGEAHPRAGADAQAAPVRRAEPRARGLERATSWGATSSRT